MIIFLIVNFSNGYSTPYRLDQNKNEGDTMLFVHNDIPSKMISIEKLPTKSFLVELNLRKKKLLLNSTFPVMEILILIWTLFSRA